MFDCTVSVAHQPMDSAEKVFQIHHLGRALYGLSNLDCLGQVGAGLFVLPEVFEYGRDVCHVADNRLQVVAGPVCS